MSRTAPVTCLLVVLSTAVPAVLCRADTLPTHDWSHGTGGTNDDVAHDVAVDGSGNVIVTGSFEGTLDFGGGNLTSAGGSDIFVVKYNASGTHQWSRRFGGAGADEGLSVAVGPSDDVVVTGRFSATVDFGGGVLASAGDTDLFLAMYDAAGTHQWSRKFGSAFGERGNAVAVGASGEVVVTGSFMGTVDFGGGGLLSAGSSDIFLAKYDASGVHQWSRGFGGVLGEEGAAIAVGASGEVVVTGSFWGTVNFGGGGLLSAGGGDIFLAKYDASGVHQWSQRFGSSTGIDTGYGIAIDGAGNVVAGGAFQGTVDFGGGGLVGAGQLEVFVAGYTPGGVHLWSRRVGSTGVDLVSAVAVDGSGNVVVTGLFQGTVNFGGGSATDLQSVGTTDIFVVEYSTMGAHRWCRRFGAVPGESIRSVTADAAGNVYLAGSYNGSVDFGGGGHGGLASAGGADAVVAKYESVATVPVITSFADVGNDQGRFVRVTFLRNAHDESQAVPAVSHYDLFRRIDALPAIATPDVSDRTLHLDNWEYAGSIPANREDSYSAVVPTLADSTLVGGTHHSVFFVRAGTDDPDVFFDSAPDSGYSIDNLAPAAPQILVYSAGILNWDDSRDPDFNYFTIYGSNTDAFVSSTLIQHSVASTLDVSSSSHVFYFVTATDFSGNEGNATMINSLTGVDAARGPFVLSVAAYPNPFNPATTLKYSVPGPGLVTVAIYDAVGARIRTVVDEDMEAGSYTVAWDGQDDRGNDAPSGIYFARVSQTGRTKSYKMTLLK